MSHSLITRVGAVFMALGVAAAAYGAHGLEKVVADPHLVEVWGTGARLHLFHGLGLLVLGRMAAPPRATAPLLALGILLFSGSLYTMALTNLRWLGAITPLGGLSFIVAWGLLAWRGPGDGAADAP
jgi:uncharacterized membrane protein YgdD (TMEM256/DUF423 family)